LPEVHGTITKSQSTWTSKIYENISMKPHGRDHHVIQSDNHVPITLCSSTQIVNLHILRSTISFSACYWRYVHDNDNEENTKRYL
jgi:hypothetical protein